MIINPVFFKWPVIIQVLKLIHLIQKRRSLRRFFISVPV
ncbi:hypothetical protein L912_2058 [Escherichia coli SCD1]|nr:hypothetical protein L912_2058 [Escherichia coli SCD1]